MKQRNEWVFTKEGMEAQILSLLKNEEGKLEDQNTEDDQSEDVQNEDEQSEESVQEKKKRGRGRVTNVHEARVTRSKRTDTIVFTV